MVEASRPGEAPIGEAGTGNLSLATPEGSGTSSTFDRSGASIPWRPTRDSAARPAVVSFQGLARVILLLIDDFGLEAAGLTPRRGSTQSDCRALAFVTFFGVPGISIDLEVKVLSELGHRNRSEPQGDDPRGQH